MDEFRKLTAEQQNSYLQKLDDFLNALRSQTLMAVISDNLRRFRESDYTVILTEVTSLAAPKIEPTTTSNGGASKVAEPKVEYTNSKSLNIDYAKAWLADEDEVDSYLEKYKEALLKEIKSGKRVQI